METNLRQWFLEMRDHVRKDPIRASLYTVFTLYLTAWYAITSRQPFGRNIYEGDWDLLILLDACRVDALREVADEYHFIGDVDSVWSIGSQSGEWIANTFTESWRGEIEQTAYISGNGFSGGVLKDGRRPPINNTTPFDFSKWSTVDESVLNTHVEVWKTNHDENTGQCCPNR